MILPIVAGPLRGRWWNPASGGKLLRVLGGTYEPAQTALFGRMIPEGATVLDVGAHVGYYTLLAARRVGATGRVVAFEPNPRNAAFLRSHVAANRCANVEVVERAIADRDGEARFRFGSGSGTGHLAGSGGIAVTTQRLDGFVEERGVAPSAMKIDVEGAEVAVLEGGRATLERHRPVLFLSVHSDALHRASCEILRALDYRISPIDAPELDAARELLCVPEG